jgi:hypothetical protein
MKITISVSADDIARGLPELSDACPIWHAARRTPLRVVHVFSDRVSVRYERGHLCQVRLPQEARWFVGNFDTGHDVKPFEFDLDVPDELLAVTP